MNFDYSYTKSRALFGKECKFRDRGPSLIIDIRSDPVLTKDFVYKRFMNKGVQNIPEYSLNEVNTEKKVLDMHGMFHEQGGWPREVNPHDEEQVERYQKRTQRDDNYVEILGRLSKKMERHVLENNAMNIYRTYYPEESTTLRRLKPYANVLNAFVVHDSPKAEVRKLSWKNESEIVVTKALGNSYVWSLYNPNEPLMVLSAHIYMNCLKYHPRENKIVGGLGSGQVAVWDGRYGGAPVGVSAPERSHWGEVVEIIWIASKTASEFMTAATKGIIKWWDYLNIKKPKEDLDYQVPITCMEYDTSMPIRYMFGTGDGYVVCGNRRGITFQEKLPWKIKVSDAAVYRISRNPAFPKILLIVTGKSANVWSEDCKEASLFWTAPAKATITDAEWSPARFSVIVAVRADGIIDIWDFLEFRGVPVYSLKVDVTSIMSLSFYEDGTLFAAGTSEGIMYVVRLSEYLISMTPEEKANFSATIDREMAREKIIEAKKKEARMKIMAAKAAEMQHEVVQIVEPPKEHSVEEEMEVSLPSEEEESEMGPSQMEEVSVEEETDKTIEITETTETTVLPEMSKTWLRDLGESFLRSVKETLEESQAIGTEGVDGAGDAE